MTILLLHNALFAGVTPVNHYCIHVKLYCFMADITIHSALKNPAANICHQSEVQHNNPTSKSRFFYVHLKRNKIEVSEETIQSRCSRT